MRRFAAGDVFDQQGIRLRVVAGRKPAAGDGIDLRLDVLTPTGWVAVPLSVVGLMADFMYENEGVLYPKPQFKGGEKVWEYLRHSVKHGWSKAEAGLRLEKRYKESTLF